jgi:hypothetical protein
MFYPLGRRSNEKDHPDYVPTISKVPSKSGIKKSPVKRATSSSLQRTLRHRKIVNCKLRSLKKRKRLSPSKAAEVHKVQDGNDDQELVVEISEKDKITQLEQIVAEQSRCIKNLETGNSSSKRSIKGINFRGN